MIFFPEKLDKDFKFTYSQKFEEININVEENVALNGLLFKSDSTKGLIFYLHGNAGSLSTWGNVAEPYTKLNYDVFILDYRGFGKSDGAISSEEQIYNDIELTYKELLKRYSEDNVLVLGYSIGTGPAAKLASTNNPKLLILQAPYYSLTDMMGQRFPFVPTFLLKYKFETCRFIKDCKMPVIIFHGDHDEVINYDASVRLKELFKPTDTLITLKEQKHNGMTYNEDYQIEIQKILAK